ncbi:orphan G-protein coupled receptor 30 [Biomphalaria glabrata]|nr:histamine H1 receptor-like [Biomphalaria glabrata]
MEATTPGVDTISGLLTWSTLSMDTDLSFWALGGFNASNISFGVYGDEGTAGENAGVWDDLWRGIPLGIVLTFLCLLTTVGNILVLHAVRTEKRLQSVSICVCV